jgi:hypothetical protein
VTALVALDDKVVNATPMTVTTKQIAVGSTTPGQRFNTTRAV